MRKRGRTRSRSRGGRTTPPANESPWVIARNLLLTILLVLLLLAVLWHRMSPGRYPRAHPPSSRQH